MPDAIITSTASTFGTISGTFAADQSTIVGTVAGIVPGTLTGSVGVPGPAGSPGAPGVGVPAGGTAGQYLQKIDGVDYNTDWVTLNLSGYALLSGANFTGRVTVPGITGDEIVNFPGFNIVPTQTEPTDKVDGDLWVYDDEGLTPSKFRVFLAGSTYNVATESWVSSLYAPIVSPAFTGNPTAPTPATSDNDTSIATTAFVKAQGYAPLASPAFTGNPTAPTAALADNDTSIATTAFVQQELLSGTANARNLEVYVRNQIGSTIPAGAIVYINGATGNRPTITLAQANNDANSAQTFGFAKTAIANNGFGFVIVRGELENVDTSALTEGVQLYLSPTTAGAYTTTKPSAPQHLVYVGICVRAHPTQGVILVAVQNGYELEELHDVSIASLANNNLLAYESSTDLWKNKTFSALGLLTSADAASTYLTSATAASTYQTISGMSSYLTTASAASTYFTIASAANKADLASPTFTGTPSLPTGTIAVTQAIGTSTTALATTEALMAAMMANEWRKIYPNVGQWTATNTGTGASTEIGMFHRRVQVTSGNTASSVIRTGVTGTQYNSFFALNASSIQTSAINWSKVIRIKARAGWQNATTTNFVYRLKFGQGFGDGTKGDLTASGIGFRKSSSKSVIELCVHNGSTLTTVDSSYTVATNSIFDWEIVSNGSGTVTLFVNGSQVATTTAGPTSTNNNISGWQSELDSTVSASTLVFYDALGQIYVQS